MRPAVLFALGAACGLLLAGQAADSDLRVAASENSPPPAGMLRSYLHGIASELLARRSAEVARIRTREQMERRKADVQAALLRLIGGLPEERQALHLKRTGRLDRGDYRVEKIVFESLPNFYVTANLYIPQRGKPPFPAVLHPTGHSVAAKNRAFYQTLSIGLVKHGFVVLTFDPIGQGERRIFYDRELETSKLGGSTTTEHSMAGIQSLLAGESVARYMVWDGMRGIDVLQSLPEVDGKRIGVTGCSGGGTLTAYLAALDPRVQVAAPSCYITSWEEQLKGTGPQDAEQQFPDQLVAGIGHADLILAAAPKPYLICSSTEDFFPLSGARQTYEEVKRLYALANAAGKIHWFYEPGPHGIAKAGREAVYAWMKRWLKNDLSAAAEPPFTTEYEEDLNVTPTGQVTTSLGGETASSLNIQRLASRRPVRGAVRSVAELERLRVEMAAEVTAALRLDGSRGALNLRTRGELLREGYRVERLLFDTAPGRYVPALLCVPARPRPRPVVYVDQAGKSAGLGAGGIADELARAGYAVLAIDPAGIGETAGGWPSGSSEWFGQEKIAWLALMVGRPLTGLRATDILRAVDVLSERGLAGAEGVIGIARGLTGVDLLHAATVDRRIQALVIEGGLLSYESVVRSPIHRGVFEAVVPGVLARYDLPHLVAALAPRPVWLINLRSPAGAPVFREEAERAYQYAAQAYAAAAARSRLRIRLRREAEGLLEVCPELKQASL